MMTIEKNKPRNHWWKELLGKENESSIASFTPKKVIVIAGSMGAIPVISELLGSLATTYPFPILVCQHRSRALPNLLPQVLGNKTPLRVKLAEIGDVIEAGTVYIAPEYAHLIVGQNCQLDVLDGRKVKFLVCAADPLLASAARVFGSRVVAIILTGSGCDGAIGVQEVKKYGGTVIVQDEATAEHFGMPKAAIQTGCVDKVLSTTQIQAALADLAQVETPEVNLTA